jgi:hypothetical protein
VHHVSSSKFKVWEKNLAIFVELHSLHHATPFSTSRLELEFTSSVQFVASIATNDSGSGGRLSDHTLRFPALTKESLLAAPH